MKNYVRTILIAFTLIASATACGDKGRMEKAGENADKAVENAGEAIEDAGDKVKKETSR